MRASVQIDWEEASRCSGTDIRTCKHTYITYKYHINTFSPTIPNHHGTWLSRPVSSQQGAQETESKTVEPERR